MWNSQEKEAFLKTLGGSVPYLTEEKKGRLLTYAAYVVEQNEMINLTAITKPEEFAIKHIIDSLMVLEHVDLAGKTVIDVGTGAGMPGLIWACVCDDTEFLLLDSLNKRIAFLERAILLLGLKNVRTVHARAEDAGRDKNLRGKFQVATARAVASLSVLLEYCLPFVEVGGAFAALKGPDVDEEVRGSANALKVLGGEISEIASYDLPQGMGSRSLIMVKKVAQTPKTYPRKAGTPNKTPL